MDYTGLMSSLEAFREHAGASNEVPVVCDDASRYEITGIGRTTTGVCLLVRLVAVSGGKEAPNAPDTKGSKDAKADAKALRGRKR